MSALVQPLYAFTSCDGPALVIGRGDTTARSPADLPLALAATLGAREADGVQNRVVVLRVTRRDDAEWARTALEWLAERGRRVVLRTAVVLSKGVEDSVRRWGTTVLLELAHRRPELQSALLGSSADSAATLLLHAQHLRRVGIEVGVHFAPLLPVIHEGRTDTLALLRHVAAADIRDAHLTVGRLTQSRFKAISEVTPKPRAISLLRAYGLDATQAQPFARVPLAGQRLVPLAMAALYHSVRLEAQGEGLRIDHCGCAAQCHLDPQLTPEFVPLLTPQLFADAG